MSVIKEVKIALNCGPSHQKNEGKEIVLIVTNQPTKLCEEDSYPYFYILWNIFLAIVVKDQNQGTKPSKYT